MADPAQPAYLCVGGVFIDDIVFPDGETRMGVPGGAGCHAAVGMQVWDQRAGIVACVGRDLPAEVAARLARDWDVQGLVHLDQPHARAWQLFEWDGSRTEVFRVEDMDPFIYAPTPDQVPPTYHAASGVYLLRDAAPLPGWRVLYPEAVLLWEPQQQFMTAENAAAFRAALPQVEIVSPNWQEARQVYDSPRPADVVRAMLDDGAGIVALRMGELGSLVARRGDDRVLKVPAVPVPQVVDQTGAGNTYCGGFLVGWAATGDLLTAACYGAVAASFALETLGVADLPPNLDEVRTRRLAWLHARIGQD